MRQSDFESTMRHQFRRSSNWRNGQFRRFKFDARNAQAAERLLELESSIVINDDDWSRLEQHLEGSACLTALTDTNRDVCFRTHPSDFAAWLRLFENNLLARD